MKAAKQTHESSMHKTVTFNMKITAVEKEKILTLAGQKGKPASRAIMELVNKEVGGGKALSLADIARLDPKDKKKVLKAHAARAARHYEVTADGFDIVEF
jgi:hypothetical protein